MSVTIFGIKNCDTMKKARAWLDEHAVEYSFHDYRKDGIDPARLERWCREAGWEKLLNRAGTTFRKLPDAEKSTLDAHKAMRLMLEHPSAIKRPVLEIDSAVLVGFDARLYSSALSSRGRPSR